MSKIENDKPLDVSDCYHLQNFLKIETYLWSNYSAGKVEQNAALTWHLHSRQGHVAFLALEISNSVSLVKVYIFYGSEL